MSRLLIRRPVWLSLLPWLAASLLRAGPVEFASPMLEPGPFLLWDTTFTVRGGGGHKDNPSYAPDFARSFREPGAFMALGAEVLLLRVPTDGNSFFLFFTGDDRRYFDAPDVRKEQTFVTQAQFKHEGTGWTTSLTAQHLYADTVFDLSEEGSGTDAPTQGHVQAQGHTLTARPALRRGLGDGWWAESEFAVSRQYFGDPLDSHQEHSPRLALGRGYGRKSSLELAFTGAWRRYDDSSLLSAAGKPLPGTREELTTRSADLAWRHVWDARRHWRTTLRGTASRAEDNGEGYFDHDKLAASAQVQFESGRWLAKVTGRFARYAYAVQRVSDLDPHRRGRDEFTTEARVEYLLRPKLRLALTYEHERADANVDFDTYTANTAYAGLEWEL